MKEIYCTGDGNSFALVDGQVLTGLDFRRFGYIEDVIRGGFMDSSVNRFLIKTVFSVICPRPQIKPWSEVSPCDFINVIAFSYRLHEQYNHGLLRLINGVYEWDSFKICSDKDIIEYMDRQERLLTPNDIEASIPKISWIKYSQGYVPTHMTTNGDSLMDTIGHIPTTLDSSPREMGGDAEQKTSLFKKIFGRR